MAETFFDNLKFIITGTGRSGSGYIAQLLSAVGIPTGHEGVFNPMRTKREDLKGDSSWQAVPYLSEFEGIVLHQTRHPAKFIRSMVTASPQFFLTPFHPYGCQRLAAPWAKKVLPSGETHPTLEWAARYYIEWNELIEPHARYRFQIETPDWVEVCRKLKYPRTQEEIDEAIAQVPARYNKHTNDQIRLNRDAIRALDCFDRLKYKAQEYGYDLLESSAYATDVGPSGDLSGVGEEAESGLVVSPV